MVVLLMWALGCKAEGTKYLELQAEGVCDCDAASDDSLIAADSPDCIDDYVEFYLEQLGGGDASDYCLTDAAVEAGCEDLLRALAEEDACNTEEMEECLYLDALEPCE